MRLNLLRTDLYDFAPVGYLTLDREGAIGANRHDGAGAVGEMEERIKPVRRVAMGILALALSGFGFVALYAYDPTLHLLDQSSPVGPVGVWLGWNNRLAGSDKPEKTDAATTPGGATLVAPQPSSARSKTR